MTVMVQENKFVIEDLCEDPVGLQGLIGDLRSRMNERDSLAVQLGFYAPAPAAIRPTATQASVFYSTEWTGFRLRAWAAYLGTHYPQSSWRRYKFDEPPLRALYAIEAALEARVFENVEIWTPEPAAVRTFRDFVRGQYVGAKIRVGEMFDPVAVGIVENRYFPIVRWGEEELLSESLVLRIGGFRVVREALIGR